MAVCVGNTDRQARSRNKATTFSIHGRGCRRVMEPRTGRPSTRTSTKRMSTFHHRAYSTSTRISRAEHGPAEQSRAHRADDGASLSPSSLHHRIIRRALMMDRASLLYLRHHHHHIIITVAVPFLLLVVRFCSIRPCNNHQGTGAGIAVSSICYTLLLFEVAGLLILLTSTYLRLVGI